jgi:uncharacterized delta-60 repeat protein
MKTQQRSNFRRLIRRLGHCPSALLLTIWLTAAVQAAPGDLDLNFGTGGIVVTPITELPYYDEPRSMQVQSDGKIVVCGQVYEENVYGDYYTISFFLARYNSTGTLDASFGTNGKIIGSFAYDGEIVGEDLALQPDGKIVVIGHKYNDSSSFDFAVNRYHSNGTLDASFGAGGRVATPIGNSFEFAESVAVGPDGKIVVAGYSYLGGGDFAFAVVRYQPDGSLDASFGAGGVVITPMSNNYISVGTVLLQPNGKIIVVGGSGINNLFTLVRYNADGSPDAEFGSNGKVIHSIGNGPASFFDGILQPDGKIVAAGYSNYNTAIIRYHADGSMDTSFAENGVFRTEAGFFVGRGLALQPDGKIVSFGDSMSSGFAISRLNAKGSPDASFGTHGRVVVPIGTNNFFQAAAGALQSDGKILALGKTFADNGDQIVVTRYLGAAAAARPTKFDFDGDGRADISVFRPADGTWYLNRSQTGFYAAQFGLATDKITPGDYTGDGKSDIAVFRPETGTWFIRRSEDHSYFSFPFGAPEDLPAPADYDGDGRTDAAVFRPSTGTWYLLNSSGSGTSIVRFGAAEDQPVPADYDGDGKADLAVFRPSDGSWWYLQSSDGRLKVYRFGAGTDQPVPGDYTGDGRAELAVFRPSTGEWFFQRSEDDSYFAYVWGQTGDLPAPGDYDGDGRFDAAVFRPSNATWYLNQTGSGVIIVGFGSAGDRPVPQAFVQ